MHAGVQNNFTPAEPESAPLLKKFRKIEEKRTNKIRKAIETFEGIGESPTKAGSMKEPIHH